MSAPVDDRVVPMYVCLCNGFTDKQVRAAGSGCSVAGVYRSLGVQPRCGKCVPMVREILQEGQGGRGDGLFGDAFAPV
jgi:bacterioferritin-associated ferredoxin